MCYMELCSSLITDLSFSALIVEHMKYLGLRLVFAHTKYV
jgi:hypothetical protein